jgi:hypothetical protein
VTTSSTQQPRPLPMQTERPQAHFDQLYVSISRSLASTSEQLEALRVDHEEGRQTLGGIRERLGEIRARFEGELSLLHQQAEWDRFTIAFFGETNAGKSTVLEALRILFSEEGRQSTLEANERDLARYEAALQSQVETVRAALHGAMQMHSEQMLAMQEATTRLSAIVQEESSTRVRMRHGVFAVAGAALGAILTYAALQVLMSQ